jgi:hypothetical protein
VLGLASCSETTGEKIYEKLSETEISYATVHLMPPDQRIQIEDINELVGLLNDVVIYEEDNSYTQYDGQAVTFTLTMVDGSQIEIKAYNPFLVIDGVGYKTEYEPCEALNAYANRLLNSDEVDNQSFHDLSDDGPFEVSEAIQSSEIYYAPSLLATNSHKITVDNQGDTDLVVYLFSETDISEPIRQMTVASNDEEDFTGLTSRFLYTIGVSSDVPTQLELTITD